MERKTGLWRHFATFGSWFGRCFEAKRLQFVAERGVKRVPGACSELESRCRQVPLGHFISWMFRTFEDQIEEWRTDEELEQFSKTLPSGRHQLNN